MPTMAPRSVPCSTGARAARPSSVNATDPNVELMWLTGRLAPDFKTIADFRKDNGVAIRVVCAQFVGLCRRTPADRALVGNFGGYGAHGEFPLLTASNGAIMAQNRRNLVNA